MVPEEKFYQLIERDPFNINKIWRVLHLSLFMGIIVSGFITALSFAYLLEAYGDNCILHANLSISNHKNDATSTPRFAQSVTPIVVYMDMDEGVETEAMNGTNSTSSNRPTTSTMAGNKMALMLGGGLPMALQDAIWSPEQLCMFCQFTPVMSMIFGIIWGVFYAVCARGDVEYTDMSMRTHRILYPLVVFSIVFLVILGSSTAYMSFGINVFCKELLVEFNQTRCTGNMNLFAVHQHYNTYDPYANSILCSTFGYVGLFCWIGQIILGVLRVFCVTDFDLIVTTVSVKEPELLNPITEEDITSIETELKML